jgi:hypothetical protein
MDGKTGFVKLRRPKDRRNKFMALGKRAKQDRKVVKAALLQVSTKTAAKNVLLSWTGQRHVSQANQSLGIQNNAI